MIRDEIKKLIEKAIKNLQKEGVFPDFEIPEISVEKPERESNGDYSTNIVLKLSKILGQKPEEIMKPLIRKITNGGGKEIFWEIFDDFEEEQIKYGFINFFVSKKYLQKQVGEILEQKEKYGDLEIGEGEKINIEFISANPTGPLTLGNGRGGFCGDVLSNVLEKAGYKPTREYYINDTGEQIKKLGHSIVGDSEAVYKGNYIEDLRKNIKEKNPEKAGEKATKIILEKIIKPTIKKMGIKFDVWFSEKKLYKTKEIDKIIGYLKGKNLAYEKDGALWFKSTHFGDDKDRVLIKSDGEKTYLASDIAYLKNKFNRKPNKLIIFLGADHHGYIGRIKAGVEALGYKKEQINFVLMQLVRLFDKGQEVKMSKREGVYITIDELIDEVGLDVARFFFLTKSPNTHLDFNMNLAKEKSEKNPVYYIQYAYARICSILRKSSSFKFQISGFKLLNHPSELDLIKQLIRLPEVVEDTAKDYQVQRLPNYALDLVSAFHKFYENCRVISKDKELTKARLTLVLAAKVVLKNILDLMGVSTPEKM